MRKYVQMNMYLHVKDADKIDVKLVDLKDDLYEIRFEDNFHVCINGYDVVKKMINQLVADFRKLPCKK